VAIRVSSSERSLVAAGALAIRDLSSSMRLPAAVMSAGSRAVDVIIGVGRAPAQAAPALGALLSRLVSETVGGEASVLAVHTIAAPFAPCPGKGVAFAVPLAWDELASVDLDSLGLAAARERAGDGTLNDAFDHIRDPTADLVTATD